MALSKTRRYAYRRYLPHLQRGRAPLFVSMGTRARWILPPEARTVVLDDILRENGIRIDLYSTVVMPDHAHLLFSARLAPNGETFALAEVMSSIRGASAHRINRLLHRNGSVWEEEFFDHIPRYGEFDERLAYICENPVKAGLVQREEDYPWLWVADGV